MAQPTAAAASSSSSSSSPSSGVFAGVCGYILPSSSLPSSLLSRFVSAGGQAIDDFKQFQTHINAGHSHISIFSDSASDTQTARFHRGSNPFIVYDVRYLLDSLAAAEENARRKVEGKKDKPMPRIADYILPPMREHTQTAQYFANLSTTPIVRPKGSPRRRRVAASRRASVAADSHSIIPSTQQWAIQKQMQAEQQNALNNQSNLSSSTNAFPSPAVPAISPSPSPSPSKPAVDSAATTAASRRKRKRGAKQENAEEANANSSTPADASTSASSQPYTFTLPNTFVFGPPSAQNQTQTVTHARSTQNQDQTTQIATAAVSHQSGDASVSSSVPVSGKKRGRKSGRFASGAEGEGAGAPAAQEEKKQEKQESKDEVAPLPSDDHHLSSPASSASVSVGRGKGRGAVRKSAGAAQTNAKEKALTEASVSSYSASDLARADATMNNLSVSALYSFAIDFDLTDYGGSSNDERGDFKKMTQAKKWRNLFKQKLLESWSGM